VVWAALVWLLWKVFRNSGLCECDKISWLIQYLLASQRRHYMEFVREAKIQV
jgi:hypothetical protein